MFLKRIQVPDFRVLKDVDIDFEPEFSPRIFPLGSLNGGGKSTLLQLIFILLSCLVDPEKHTFIQNLLDGFEIEKNKTQKLLTTMYLFDRENDRDIELHFVCHQNKILIEKNEPNEKTEKSSNTIVKFSMFGLGKKLQKEIFEIEQEMMFLVEEYRKNKNKLDNIIKTEQWEITISDIEDEIGRKKWILEDKKRRQKEIENTLDEISNYLNNQNLTYICNYTNTSNTESEYALLCKSEQLDASEINNLLKQLASKIFLAAPFTQVFLFLPKEQTKLLFKEHKNKASYYSTLEQTKIKLPNLFTYDILSVDYIIEFFKAARDKDFKQAIETGQYGDAYQSVLQALNSILGNKKINIDTDLSGVNFKIDKDGVAQELYPEDLSHGELKRLSIYVWLKYKNIQDSIVLMDEVENAFHPDWQYKIISDLGQWGNSNQYILATHSYELCQAVTPAHVKELEPRLPILLAENQVKN